jgi:pilus assembly protein CpaC
MDEALGQSLGVRWPDAIRFSAAAIGRGDGGTTGLNYTVSFGSAQGWISHLVREGWARILASPDLYVRLGEEASFHSGGEFPVPSTSENYGRYQHHIEWKPFGLTVKVRPQSGDKFHINSDIRVAISEVSPATAIDGIPGLTRRDLTTKMSSQDGETVILSGLLRQASSQEKTSVPLLARIPLLGSLLFSHRSERSEGSEILMAVTFSLTTRSRDRERLEEFKSRFAREHK